MKLSTIGIMTEQLYLHIPEYDELWYRQKIMEDPETMDYNKGYDMDFEGYDRSTGCIAFPKQEWADWYDYFINQEPECFYAYIARESDGRFIGEVNVHMSDDNDWYEMGIVLEGKYRGKGYAVAALKLLLQYAFEKMGAKAVHNDFEEERQAAVKTHISAGFSKYRQENGIIELLITKEQYFRQKAIENMTHAISDILADNQPSIYLYGSCCMDDFRLGWSDIDILVLTKKRISQTQAEKLLILRQELSEKTAGNAKNSDNADRSDSRYYRLFEGGMLTLDGFIANEQDCVVYWGTTGQRITDRYTYDSFLLAELLQSGKLLYGEELRSRFTMPAYTDFYGDVKLHYEAIRQYAQVTDRSFYSFGWLLDIARGIYTLCKGAVISKTEAAQWALDNNLCPVTEALEMALKVRKNPLAYQNDSEIFDYAQALGPEIQRFADVLEKELSMASNYNDVLLS